MVVNNFIELKDISFFYKKNFSILNNLNTKIYGGKITALLGINGSGKTTLFKILTGLYKPSSGVVMYNDIIVSNDNLLYYKGLLGFMPEVLHLYNDMRVKDVLIFLAALKGYGNVNFEEILSMVFLNDHANKKIKDLSKGMKQKLNLAQAIIGSPKILFFDEPSNGFDCGSITMFYNVLRKLANDGAIVFISSHHLTEIYGNVDNVLILSNGCIVKEIDINFFNLSDDFLFKEVFVLVDDVIDDVSALALKRLFPDASVNKSVVFCCRVNGRIIVNLILFLVDLKFSIKDIRIENRILEDMLIKLS